MSYDDDKTKIIGSKELSDELHDDYSEFNHAYDDSEVNKPDELEYIEEEAARKREAVKARAEYEAAKAEEYEKTKPVKKSKKGLVIAIVILLLLALAGGAYALLFGGDKSQPLDVDLSKTMTEPDVTGYNGEGTIGEITVKSDAVDDIIRNLESDEQKTKVAAFFETDEYDVDKSSQLSTGDQVVISASYDSDAAETAGITVTNSKSEYTLGQLREKKVEEETTEASAVKAQWYRHISEAEDELAITCLLIDEEGTSVTLPIEFMYCYAGGPMSEMVDTSQEPNLTYGGTGYYMEDGSEAPSGTITEVDDSHIKYSVRQYGDKFTISVNYSVNSDGSINVTSASGGEIAPPTGTYEAISSGQAASLGGSN